MKQLSFKISAKTARLFGRENASNAEAAISELVKNAYDADATHCLVCLIPTYDSPPSVLSRSEYQYIQELDSRVANFYFEKESDVGNYHLRLLNEAEHELAVSVVRNLRDLWIVDNGTGMSAETIERCWMVIGTNDKEQNTMSEGGRARTGAKGIGRFALDRLGSDGTVYSTNKHAGKIYSIEWYVDWNHFDSEGRILDEVVAELETESEPLTNVLTPLRYFTSGNKTYESLWEQEWNTGTAIKIGRLRDEWTRSHVDKLFKTLEALIPPIEQRELNLYLFDESTLDAYGLVDPEILEDFDYKLIANINRNAEVTFKIVRNELLIESVDPDLFDFKAMRNFPFDKESFDANIVTYKKPVTELISIQDKVALDWAREVGPFSIQLLFYKKRNPSRRDSTRYPYRPIQARARTTWLEQFGGIKIYRDNFAVRPYGEVDGRSFDWLSLGQRVAANPLAASRKGWRVSPQNLVGTVNISREVNPHLMDQANREGILENEHFRFFRDIILGVIKEFENDRSHIHYHLNELYKKKNKTEIAKTEGAKTAEKIVSQQLVATAEDAEKLAMAIVAQLDEIRELKDEQSMLRALSTLGMVLVSFSHEMGQLQNTMGSRSTFLVDVLKIYISEDELANVAKAFNPFAILREWEEDDNRVKQWFMFVLSSLRANSRRRQRRCLREYLDHAHQLWDGFLTPRQIALDISFNEKDVRYELLAFDIDLDSIFNNLILNSVEAFLSKRHNGPRVIYIHLDSVDGLLQIDYSDSGPGLDPLIRDPNEIFQFGVTTKYGARKDSGTGLGMWILSTVVHRYGGSHWVLKPGNKVGFLIRMTLKGIDSRR